MAASIPDAAKYKTQICNFWKEGACPWQQRCRFAHGYSELKSLARYSHLNVTPNVNNNNSNNPSNVNNNNSTNNSNNNNTNNNDKTKSNNNNNNRSNNSNETELNLLRAENNFLKLRLKYYEEKYGEIKP